MKTLRHSNLLIASAILAGLAIGNFANAEPKAGKDTKKKGGEAVRAERGPRPEGGPQRMGPPDGGAELGKFWENEKLAEKLALTEDQISQLDATVEGTKKALEALKGSEEPHHEALKAEFEKDNPDLNNVLAAQAQINNANSERMKILLSHRVAVQTILTQDQEKTLREGRREGGRPGMRQRRAEGGPEGAPGEGGGRRRGGQMRDKFANVETLEELNAALDEADVPAERREKIVELWTRRKEGGGPPPPPDRDMMDDGGDNAPLPPLPPEDAQ